MEQNVPAVTNTKVHKIGIAIIFWMLLLLVWSPSHWREMKTWQTVPSRKTTPAKNAESDPPCGVLSKVVHIDESVLKLWQLHDASIFRDDLERYLTDSY